MEHLTETLFSLFIVLLATKVGDELFKRLGQPSIVGEILGGLLVGPAVSGGTRSRSRRPCSPRSGRCCCCSRSGSGPVSARSSAVGGTALAVAILGMALPFAAGYGLATLLDLDQTGRLFLAAALTATSVGITSAALRSLNALGTRSAKVILGAAVIDDVLALLLVAALAALTGGNASPAGLGLTLVLAVAFIGIVRWQGPGSCRVARRC